MNALDLLLNRHSASRLTTPGPTGSALDNIIHAGMRAPDHGALRPWRFVLIESDGLGRFSKLLQQAELHDNADDVAIMKRAAEAPFGAPLIITVIAYVTENNKVPNWEQILSAGCAVQAMQMAALAQGFNGIWRTGSWAQHPIVRQGFACREQDEIVGFLYLGTPQLKSSIKVSPPDSSTFVSYF